MPSNRGLTIRELEDGLSMLAQGAIAADAFWDANLMDFRHALVAAVQETSDYLVAGQIPADRRLLLQTQLDHLRGYIQIVDHYVASRERQSRLIN